MISKVELKEDLNVVLNSLAAYKQSIERLEREQQFTSIEATQREYNEYALKDWKRQVKLLERKQRMLESSLKNREEKEQVNLIDEAVLFGRHFTPRSLLVGEGHA